MYLSTRPFVWERYVVVVNCLTTGAVRKVTNFLLIKIEYRYLMRGGLRFHMALCAIRRTSLPPELWLAFPPVWLLITSFICLWLLIRTTFISHYWAARFYRSWRFRATAWLGIVASYSSVICSCRYVHMQYRYRPYFTRRISCAGGRSLYALNHTFVFGRGCLPLLSVVGYSYVFSWLLLALVSEQHHRLMPPRWQVGSFQQFIRLLHRPPGRQSVNKTSPWVECSRNSSRVFSFHALAQNASLSSTIHAWTR